jgi:hypothetical protein
MKILVIGLGSSAARLDGYDYYIGVNDCPFDVNALVLVDPPRVFRDDRKQRIINHPAILYTDCLEWHAYRNNVVSFERCRYRSDVSGLGNKDKYPYSICSPFVAVVHAYFMGATEIHLNGVDLIGHKSLGHPDKIARCQKDFAALRDELKRLGVELCLATDQKGALTNILKKSLEVMK